jgi:oligopeptide transport system substrate-binding protein
MKFPAARLSTAAILAAAILCITLAGTAEAGQVIRRYNPSEPETLDPHKSSGQPEYWIQNDLFEGLLTCDALAKPVPGVAERWEASADGKNWTFHLRDDAKWSDGTPLTAEDFVYSFRRAVDPKTASAYASALSPIIGADEIIAGRVKEPATLGVRAVDPHTLQIDLKEPTPYLLPLLTLGIAFPVPRQATEKYGDQWTRPGKIVSNGPFVMQEWVPQQQIVLARNPLFHDAATVKLDGVRFIVTEDKGTSFKRYRAGDLDTAIFPGEELPWVHKNLAADLHQDGIAAGFYLEINMERPPLGTDRRLREALSLVIDREILVYKVNPAEQKPSYSYTPPGLDRYTPQPVPFKDMPTPARIARAKQLWAEARGGDKTPIKVKILYPTDPRASRQIQAIGAMWRQALGVEIEADNREFQVFEAMENQRDYQVSYAGWVADYNDPWTFLLNFKSDAAVLNHTGYKNPAYDALLDQSIRARDPEQRMAILESAERVLIADAPVMPIEHSVIKELVNPKVQGWQANVLDLHPSRFLSFEE